MKKNLLVCLVFMMGITVNAQQKYAFKQLFPQQKAVEKIMVGIEPVKSAVIPQNGTTGNSGNPSERSADAVTILTLGSSANAYSYGYGGGQKSIVSAIPELNMVTNFHRMGGVQDPGGYSGGPWFRYFS
jgi:hypothetical protein